MKRLLTGKNVVITGTNRGIGNKMVSIFAQNGANVFAHARSQNDEHEAFCQSIAKENDTQVIPVYFDLSNQIEIKEGIKALKSYNLPVDGLVNNAGIGGNSLFAMTSMEELRQIFEADFFGPYYLTQYICKLMVRNGGGSVVSISSTSALDGNSGKTGYGSAKAALLAMTKCIAEELGEKNIRANTICPGVVCTEMSEMLPDYILEIEKESTPRGLLASPEDIANTAVFLISDSSSYITGQTIRVDGGKTLYNKRRG